MVCLVCKVWYTIISRILMTEQKKFHHVVERKILHHMYQIQYSNCIKFNIVNPFRDVVHSSNVLWASSGCILMSWRRTGSFIVEFVRNVDSFKSAISSLSYIIPEHNSQSLCYLTLIEGTANSSNRKRSAIWLHGLTCCVGKGFRKLSVFSVESKPFSNAACQPVKPNRAHFTIRRIRSALNQC